MHSLRQTVVTIFKLFPDANEGLLNNYLQRYANQNALAEYAIKINLSDFIKFQKGDSLEFNDGLDPMLSNQHLDFAAKTYAPTDKFSDQFDVWCEVAGSSSRGVCCC